MASCGAPEASENSIREFAGNHEIVSLVGTVCADGAHIHVSLADSEGHVVGGHLISAIVYTTAEVVLHEARGWRFSRQLDSQTHFKELVVSSDDAPSRWLRWLRTLVARP